jgi:hypothetical protein
VLAFFWGRGIVCGMSDGFELGEFIWTFPVCVLATNFTRDPDRGVLLDDNILFAAPEVEVGVQALAVFTDLDLAERFRDKNLHRDSLEVLPLSPKMFVKVLRRARGRYKNVVVDPNYSIRIGRLIDFEDVLSGMEQHLRDEGQQGNPSNQE